MKNIFSKLCLPFIAILIVTSCKEIGPPINLTPDASIPVGAKKSGLIQDTLFTESVIQTPDVKRIFIEEFSGQNCPNCPKGKTAVKQIISSNVGLVSAVTLHTIAFAPQSDPIGNVDFRTQSATDISNIYGNGVGIPCAMVNRVLFSGQSARAMTTPSTWSGYVTNELTKSSYVNIKLQSFWDATINQDSIKVELHFTGNASADSLSLSLLLIEDKIEAPQDSMGIEVEKYEHENILRAMVTTSSGLEIKGAKTAGNVKVYQFRTEVIDGAKWNINNMKIIAFVHKQNTNNKDIVQVAETVIK